MAQKLEYVMLVSYFRNMGSMIINTNETIPKNLDFVICLDNKAVRTKNKTDEINGAILANPNKSLEIARNKSENE